MSEALRTLVRSVLARPEVKKISFTLGGLQTGPSSFELIGENLLNGKIDVVHDAKMGANAAKYRFTANKLFLGFKASGATADNEALIVHEAVHMACDLSAVSVKVGVDEAAGYVAQCLYFYYKNEEVLSKPDVSPSFADPILKEAWPVAMKARTTKVLADEEIKALLKAISKHHLYAKTHSVMKHYDGV